MLTLILQTQEGHQIEINVQPEDTFADLKNQYADHEVLGLSDSLEQLITNGASVEENTKIFDYVTGSAHEWFSTDTAEEQLSSRRAETEIKFRECCARDCSNNEATTPGKPFFPLPTDRDRLAVCLMEIKRPDLYDRFFGLDEEESQEYFLCSSHNSRESIFLHADAAVEQPSAFSLLKPKNDLTRSAVIEETILTKKEKEEEEEKEKEEEKEEKEEEEEEGAKELEKVNYDAKDSMLDLIDNVENNEHPEDLCRLCGKFAANPTSLYPVKMENFEEEFSLADKINLCLPVTITISDSLPKQICHDCHVKLNVCHELALASLQTEEKLKILLRESELRADVKAAKNCPRCVDGDMRNVKESGLYRREDLKNDLFAIKADKIFVPAKNIENTISLVKVKLPISSGSIANSTTRTEDSIGQLDRDATTNNPTTRGSSSEKIFSNETSINHAHSRVFDEKTFVAKIVPENEKKKITNDDETKKILYACNFCDKKFARKGILEKHIASYHNETSKDNAPPRCYKCKACCEAFSHEIDALTHARDRHVLSFANNDIDTLNGDFFIEQLIVRCLYVCEFCDNRFTLPSSLHEHRESMHAKNLKYSCTMCDLTFDTHRKLATHRTLSSHNRILDQPGIKQLYVCKYCDKTFLRHSGHSSHARQHRDAAEPYLCRICNVNFIDYPELSRHRDESHPYRSSLHERSSLAYDCQYCAKKFSQEIALMKHIRMHTGERPYKCTICDKGFSQSSGLYTHLRIHSDLRPYGCEKCPRTFKIKGDRDNHTRKHAGNRPYKCEFCDKSFMTQHVYSQHCKIHTNERPYRCDICGQAFRRSHVLTVHARRHTGEKPHVCEICPKAYRQRGDLTKHRKLQHGIKNKTNSSDIYSSANRPNVGFDNSDGEKKFDDIRGNSNSALMLTL